MEFHIGDPVMHCTHGFGHVVRKEERVIFNQKSLYYAISIRDMIVWVPANDQLETRLRSPITKKAFEKLFMILGGAGEPLPVDRQERRIRLLDIVKDGQAASYCRVLRDLATFQYTHPLNEYDQTLMKRSREALLGEWMHALSIPVSEAEANLHQMLGVGAPAIPVKRPATAH
jgi:RNA polymerase-interacting CarD/CdnL/TRCF family regulator